MSARGLPAPLGAMPASQWVLRGGVLLLPVVAMVAALPQLPPGWLLALVVASGLAWARAPESSAGPVVLLVVVSWWGVAVEDPLGWRLLVASGALLAAHVSATLASYGPPVLAVDRDTWLLWLRRGLLSFLAAAVVWLAVGGLPVESAPPLLFPLALAAVGVGALAALVVLRPRPDG